MPVLALFFFLIFLMWKQPIRNFRNWLCKYYYFLMLSARFCFIWKASRIKIVHCNKRGKPSKPGSVIHKYYRIMVTWSGSLNLKVTSAPPPPDRCAMNGSLRSSPWPPHGLLATWGPRGICGLRPHLTRDNFIHLARKQPCPCVSDLQPSFL